MKKKIAENLAKFFYDCGKVTFAMLVIGALVKKPFVPGELVFGLFFTLLLILAGSTIDAFKEDQ